MPMTADSSDEEWEEVEESQAHEEEVAEPCQSVEIELDVPKAVKKKLKREKWDREMVETCLRRAAKRFDKDMQLAMHKVHLLCLLALSMKLNRICNSPELRAFILSILPERYTDVKTKHSSALFFSRFIQDFSKIFNFENGMEKLQNCGLIRVPYLENLLMRVVEKREVKFQIDFVLLFVAAFRVMGFNTRLVLSLQPVPLKPPTEREKAMASAAKDMKPSETTTKRKLQSDDKIPQVDGPSDTPPKKRMTRSRAKKATQDEMQRNSRPGKKPNNKVATLKSVQRKKSSKVAERDQSKENNSERKSHGMKDAIVVLGKENVEELSQMKRRSTRKNCFARNPEPLDADKTPLVKPLSKTKAKRNLTAGGKKSRRKITAMSDHESGSDNNFVPVKSSDDSEDSDFEVEKKKSPPKKKHMGKVKKEYSSISKSRKSPGTVGKGKITSRNSAAKKSANAQDYYDQWLEVYSEQEGKWISLDVFRCAVNHHEQMEKFATPVVHYVLGFDNDGHVKDITARYSSKWLTESRKLRVGIADKNWWKETLAPYGTPDTQLDAAENKEMQEHLLAQPMPTTISAFKNHPLFRLRRHLLKYEAIYPEDVPAVGLIRGEEVLPRSAIHTLHTRDKWLQEARVVMDGEKPYKLVASIWINIKLKQDMSTLSMPLFGKWQTGPYIPQVAKDGKVPRNQYGNVDLFKPGMLPIGCVQMRQPGLNKIARKLDIDIATAITGFDTHHGYPHPVTDGYVVCKEFEETLIAAWEEDQVHVAERERKKREERVYSRWKLFIKAMVAKERIKRKYAVNEEVPCDEKIKDDKRTPITAGSGTVWQAKRLQAVKSRARGRAGRAKRGRSENLFPFETNAE